MNNNRFPTRPTIPPLPSPKDLIEKPYGGLGRVPSPQNLMFELEDRVNQLLDMIRDAAPPLLREVVLESKQDTMGKALLADIVDVIPFVGDAANTYRVRHGGGQPDRVSRQAIDLMVGSLPEPAGVILDALSPTNLLTFLREAERSKPPNNRP